MKTDEFEGHRNLWNLCMMHLCKTYGLDKFEYHSVLLSNSFSDYFFFLLHDEAGEYIKNVRKIEWDLEHM